jgi:hypothetical protein
MEAPAKTAMDRKTEEAFFALRTSLPEKYLILKYLNQCTRMIDFDSNLLYSIPMI